MGESIIATKTLLLRRTLRKFEPELLCIDPSGAPVSLMQLTIVTANVNARVRDRGLSAREMWTQQDQFNNDHISLSDQELIMAQGHARSKNLPYSEKSKAPLSQSPPPTQLLLWVTSYICLVMAARPRGRTSTWWLLLMVHGMTSESLPANSYVAHHTGWRNRNAFSSQPQSPCKRSQPLPIQHHPMSGEDADDNDPIAGATPDVTPDPPPLPDIPPAIVPPTLVVQAPTTTGSSATPGESSAACQGGENMPTQSVTPSSPVAAVNSLQGSARPRHRPGHLADYICEWLYPYFDNVMSWLMDILVLCSKS